VIGLVFPLDSLAIFRVGLGVPAVHVPSAHLLDSGSALTLHIFPHKLFERAIIRKNLVALRLFVCANRKQGHDFRVWFFGESLSIEIAPWDIWIACGHFMGPEHPKS
jgi:hypothetical protein